MSRTCTVCKHPSRDAINAAILGTDSLRTIASRWSVSKTALLRHKTDHLPAAIVKAAEVEEAISGGRFLDRLTALNRETLSILQEPRTGRTKDGPLALKAITRAEKQLLIEGQLLAEMKKDPAVDLTQAPERVSLRAAILVALEPHPAARAAVINAIEREGTGNNAAA